MSDTQVPSKELDALIAKVNARIPSSVTPATRIEIHPADWLTLVDALNAETVHEQRDESYDNLVYRKINEMAVTLSNLTEDERYHVIEHAMDLYHGIATQLLSNDAEDAKRFRWLTDRKRGDFCWTHVLSEEDRADFSFLNEAIDARLTLKGRERK